MSNPPGPVILVVDDDPMVLDALTATLQRHGYRTLAIGDPIQARRMLDVVAVDAVVADLSMSIADGRCFAETVSTECARPLLVVTGAPRAQLAVEHFGGTARRACLAKPFDGAQLVSALAGILDVVAAPDDDHVITAELATGFARALALRDVETEAHARRVALWTRRVATALGMNERAVFWAEIGALLHDIGKIGVPDAILKKPGPLDESEWAIMRLHSEYGAQLIAPVRRLAGARDVVLHHHESWDGSGYPHRLAREAIPLAARAFAPIDAYDAMTSDRPYRRGMSHEEALSRLTQGSGKQFDPAVVEALTSIDTEDWLAVRVAVAAETSPGSSMGISSAA